MKTRTHTAQLIQRALNEDPYDINVLPAGSDVDWIISVNRKGWAEVQYENNDEDFFQLIEDNVPRIIRNMGV